MESSCNASDVLGQMFERLANVAFEENKTLMDKNHIPGFAFLEFDAPLNEFDCAPNLTWTKNQFFNQPHKDSKDISDFALAVFIPISKRTGELAHTGENYNVTGGRFVFPNHRCGIDFAEKGLVKMVWRAREYRHSTLPCRGSRDHTCLAMSLQINRKTATTSKSIEDGSIHKRPAKKLKDPRDMFVGGHNHLMGDASDVSWFFLSGNILELMQKAINRAIWATAIPQAAISISQIRQAFSGPWTDDMA
ncbi:hypothetical protein PCASD_08484 [Puccinia coronata f. sp. avenae]|uniref:Tet-like 2OG-Fe(II) oxygenase domain-containing protein n=1 Tax=Puccinia coronata f. sp. avenae TaxID=200324 RepID=A0A2N5UY43_9BASI|nr:hypothetical protein PCASD_08484 [Puccinia coronata f. sp. avenae]